jgi:DNA-binding response OmpR family regulator
VGGVGLSVIPGNEEAEQGRVTDDDRGAPAQLRQDASDSHWAVRNLAVGPISIDFDLFVATANGHVLRLTRLEFDILVHLVRNQNRVVSQKELMQEVVRGTFDAESSLIRVHVAHLRRKLGALASTIETVRGRGIRFAHDTVQDPIRPALSEKLAKP